MRRCGQASEARSGSRAHAASSMAGTMDVNADLGESFGRWTLGDDARLVRHLSSANLACGLHAGDPVVMDRTVALCAAAGVAIGAQPGYPDLQGFGRRALRMTADEVEVMVRYQIGALHAFCRAHGAELRHVKPHGALYNEAAGDPILAAAIARATARFSGELALYGLASSEPMRSAAEAAGIRFVPEAFADRAYRADGTLQPRSEPDALVADPDAAARQAVDVAVNGRVTAVDGSEVPIRAESICCHGDTPGAVEIAAGVRRALAEAGVTVVAPSGA
jgi:5-oxoprolinase (ATP-hydrolysing) subunit A